MMEFDLINRYFKRKGPSRPGTILGVGDDCAILQLHPGRQLVVTSDTLVSGVHFHPQMAPEAIGHKALAVNLSDLASMGAEPAWVILALTLPEANEAWVKAFSEGLLSQAEYYGVELVGGDTTAGPLTITVTAHGTVPQGKALLRSGAKPGETLYVTGNLGDAGGGLALIQGGETALSLDQAYLVERLLRPTPRVLAGQVLRGIASACMDISDGLVSDLGHMCRASGCGAAVDLEDLPISQPLRRVMGERAESLALASGDDYELLFTVPEENRGLMETALRHNGVSYTAIGRMIGGERLLWQREGEPVDLQLQGYQHFAEPDDGQK